MAARAPAAIGKLRRVLREPHGLRKAYHLTGMKLAKRLRWRFTPFLPVRLDVEPIDTCNFACDHCQVTHWARKGTTLDPARFRELLDALPMLREIKLQGMGEPLLHRDLPAMLEEGERRGIAMLLFTNGSIHTEAIASRLASLRNATVVFSVDGATAETFEAIRVNGNFARVVANVADLVRRRGGAERPRIELWTVATARNAHEVPDIVRLADELGVDKVTVTTMLTDWGKDSMADIVEPLALRGEQPLETGAITREATRVAVDVETGPMYSTERPCPWPWNRSYVAANGDVVPCCVIADSSVVKMGNVFEEPFAKIWNNARYRELRRAIATDDVPPYCLTCYRRKA